MPERNPADVLEPALAAWPEALRRALAALSTEAQGDSPVVLDLPELAEEAGAMPGVRAYGAALANALAAHDVRVRVIGDLADGMAMPGAVLLGRIDGLWCVLQVPAGNGSAVALDADGATAPTPLPVLLALTEGESLMLVRQQPAGETAMPAYMPNLRAWWQRYAELFLAGLGINLLALVTPFFSMLVYDKIVGNGITETLWALAIGVLLAAVLDFVLRTARAWYVEQLVYKSDRVLDRSILERLQASREATLPPVGQVLNRYKELVAAREFITSNYVLSAADLPFMLFFILALWLVGGPVVIVFLVCAGAMVAMHAIFSIPAQDYGNLARETVMRKMSLLVEILAAGELLKTSRLRVPTGRRWRALTDDAALSSAKQRFWSSVSMGSTNFWVVVCSTAVLVAGVYRIEMQEMTTGGLVACSMLASRAMGVAASVALLFSRYKDFRRAGKELDTLIAEPPASESVSTAPPRRIDGRMVTHDLCYRFSEQAPFVLRDANISIAPGERIALLGHPGSGKTTLLRCLAGVMAPSSGTVLLDGVNLRAHHPVSRARWMSYKPQEPHIFEGTLEDNVRAGLDEADAAAVLQALEIAGLGSALLAGELSLDMRLDSRGTNLSGGQRQAVALARSVLGNPSMLLLDEPTAGLDQAGERAVAARLREFAEGRTLIVATHSPLLLPIVDRLIVVDHGRIVADGPREKILLGQQAS